MRKGERKVVLRTKNSTYNYYLQPNHIVEQIGEILVITPNKRIMKGSFRGAKK